MQCFHFILGLPLYIFHECNPGFELYKNRASFMTIGQDLGCDWTTLNQTEEMLTSSTPMTPAPITIISSGTFFRDRAPVDDTTLPSSI